MTIDRRSFLSLAALPLLSRLALPGAATAATAATANAAAPPRGPRRAPARMVLVWLDGGVSHVDVFDGKPEAPGDVRGDGRWIHGAGDAGREVWLSDHLPKLAARFDRCALLRSMTHGEGNHDRASTFVLTGQRPSPVLAYPSLGAVVSLDTAADDPLPPYVALPTMPEAAGAGFLPAHHGPFVVPGDAAAVPAPRGGDAHVRSIVERLDELDGVPRSADEELRDRLARKAAAMRADARVRELFDPACAPAAWRQRFGNHALGRACLQAARLALGGVRTVLVRDTGWDHHQDVRRALTQGFPGKLPQLDDAVAGLLDTLREQGAEDDVLVVVASEFGRTPRLNPDAGRDHWARAQSVLLAGAGIRRGAVVGSTDARGEEPATAACSPGDLWATMLAARGHALDTVFETPAGRPVRIVPDGAAPIAALLR